MQVHAAQIKPPRSVAFWNCGGMQKSALMPRGQAVTEAAVCRPHIEPTQLSNAAFAHRQNFLLKANSRVRVKCLKASMANFE